MSGNLNNDHVIEETIVTELVDEEKEEKKSPCNTCDKAECEAEVIKKKLTDTALVLCGVGVLLVIILAFLVGCSIGVMIGAAH